MRGSRSIALTLDALIALLVIAAVAAVAAIVLSRPPAALTPSLNCDYGLLAEAMGLEMGVAPSASRVALLLEDAATRLGCRYWANITIYEYDEGASKWVKTESIVIGDPVLGESSIPHVAATIYTFDESGKAYYVRVTVAAVKTG